MGTGFEGKNLWYVPPTSTISPPQPIVASHQGVSQVGVQPQYTNATNPDLQQLNQRHKTNRTPMKLIQGKD